MDISFFNISISIIGSVITLCVLRVSILRLYIFRYYSDGVIIVLFHFIPRSNMHGVRSGRDRMIVGFTTTSAISAYHHWRYEFKSRSRRGVLDTTLCGKVNQWLATGRWFSPGTPVSPTNKTDRHNVTDILLKVTLNTINQTKPSNMYVQYKSNGIYHKFTKLTFKYLLMLLLFKWSSHVFFF